MYTLILLIVIVLGAAILVPSLVRVAKKRDEPVNNRGARAAMNPVETPQKSALVQLTLFFIMTITLVLSIWVRLTGAGWLIIIWGIPLLILAILHFVYQLKAIGRVPTMEPSYVLLILLSNLLLFLSFALQVDFGDARGSYLAIAVFYEKYFERGSLHPIPNGQSSIFMYISIGFLIALIVSWFFLLGKSFLKQENNFL